MPLHKTTILALVWLAGAIHVYAQSITGSRPNIILIVADDLGYGELGCYGQQKIATPFIDRMAANGIRFTGFYAGTAVCAPSRASLMTGLHTGHTAVRGNKGVQPEGQYPLPAGDTTMASILAAAGYRTAAFGKWGLGYPGSSGEPLKQGFASFFGYNCQSLAHNYYPDHLWKNDQRIALPENLAADAVYSADLIHQQAIKFLREQHDQPFFLFLPYTLPHASLYGPHDSIYQHYVAKFNEQPQPLPASARKTDYKQDEHPHAAFAAMVTRLDHYVGEILRTVHELGLDEQTLILFTSDNGPHREGGADPAFFNSSGSLRGIKRDLYEGGIRVPFIAIWKGKIRAGFQSAYPGTFWDLLPSFEQLAGIQASGNIDGISILQAITTGTQAQQHKYLYWEFHESGGRQAVRWGKWKAIKQNVSTISNPPMELYNLDTDPVEQHNIAAQFPGIVKQMEKMMQEAHVSNKDWPLLKSEINTAASSTTP